MEKEDLKNRERHTSPAKVWGITFAIVILLATTVILIHSNKNRILELFNRTPAVELTEEVVQNDVVETSPTTIEQVLQARLELKEQKRADSVFMSLPDVILIAILIKTGTDATIKDIVHEYEYDLTKYKNVQTGSNIQKDIIQQLDTVQKKQ